MAVLGCGCYLQLVLKPSYFRINVRKQLPRDVLYKVTPKNFAKFKVKKPALEFHF